MYTRDGRWRVTPYTWGYRTTCFTIPGEPAYATVAWPRRRQTFQNRSPAIPHIPPPIHPPSNAKWLDLPTPALLYRIPVRRCHHTPLNNTHTCRYTTHHDHIHTLAFGGTGCAAVQLVAYPRNSRTLPPQQFAPAKLPVTARLRTATRSLDVDYLTAAARVAGSPTVLYLPACLINGSTHHALVFGLQHGGFDYNSRDVYVVGLPFCHWADGQAVTCLGTVELVIRSRSPGLFPSTVNEHHRRIHQAFYRTYTTPRRPRWTVPASAAAFYLPGLLPPSFYTCLHLLLPTLYPPTLRYRRWRHMACGFAHTMPCVISGFCTAPHAFQTVVYTARSLFWDGTTLPPAFIWLITAHVISTHLPRLHFFLPARAWIITDYRRTLPFASRIPRIGFLVSALLPTALPAFAYCHAAI